MFPRIICLDIGEKRIGVAVSDPLGITAQPLEYIENEGKQKALLKIKDMVCAYNAQKIVVGMPFSLHGGEGPQAQKISRFIEFLRKNLEISVETADERFSTSEAENILIEGNVRREKRKHHRDKIAAALILQKYMDMNKSEDRIQRTEDRE